MSPPRENSRRTPRETQAEISTGTVRIERDRDDPDAWHVHVNGVPSSYLDLADPRVLAFEYQQWTAAILAATHPGAAVPTLRAVHLGGAGCAFPRHVAATRPGSRQLVLEIDAALVELVREAFGATGPAGFKLKVADARAGLRAVPDATQDTVVRDAFAGAEVPAHLTTLEFLREARRVLAPGGVWIANLADAPPMPLSRREAATALEVFTSVALVAEPSLFRGRRYGNALLVASDAPLPVAELVRGLSGGAAPARVLAEQDLRHFCAGADVLRDEPDRARHPGTTTDEPPSEDPPA